MTTTENQKVISAAIVGPYMVLKIEPNIEVVLGRSKTIYEGARMLAVIPIVDGEIVANITMPRAEAQRAQEVLAALL